MTTNDQPAMKPNEQQAPERLYFHQTRWGMIQCDSMKCDDHLTYLLRHPASERCVECKHVKLDPWRGYCRHEVSPFGKRPVRYCGHSCKEFEPVATTGARCKICGALSHTFQQDQDHEFVVTTGAGEGTEQDGTIPCSNRDVADRWKELPHWSEPPHEASAFGRLLEPLAHALASITSDTNSLVTVPKEHSTRVWTEFWEAERRLLTLQTSRPATVAEGTQVRGMSDAEMDEINAGIREQFHRETSARDCMVASEPVLAQEWNTPEEDEAWKDLAVESPVAPQATQVAVEAAAREIHDWIFADPTSWPITGKATIAQLITIISKHCTADAGEVERLAKELEYAAWKGFNQGDSEFEKGYKHAMGVAAKCVRESLTKTEGDDGP